MSDHVAIESAAAEMLTWHAAAQLPDADLDVLLWVLERDGASDWTRGWWDGEAWRDAGHGGVIAGTVTHWAEPAGPGASAAPLRVTP